MPGHLSYFNQSIAEKFPQYQGMLYIRIEFVDEDFELV